MTELYKPYYHRDIGAVASALAAHRYMAIMRTATERLGHRPSTSEMTDHAHLVPSLDDMLTLWARRMDRWLGETSKYTPHQGTRECLRRVFGGT